MTKESLEAERSLRQDGKHKLMTPHALIDALLQQSMVMVARLIYRR